MHTRRIQAVAAAVIESLTQAPGHVLSWNVDPLTSEQTITQFVGQLGWRCP